MTTPTPRPGNFPYTPLTTTEFHSLIKEYELSYAQVGQACSISGQHAKKIANGKRRLTADIRARFVRYIDACRDERDSEREVIRHLLRRSA